MTEPGGADPSTTVEAGAPEAGMAAGTAEEERRAIADAVVTEDAPGGRRRQVRLTAPPSFRLLDLGAIAADVVVTAGESQTLTSVYWDTRDLRLTRWGCTLRHRAGEGWTLRVSHPEDPDAAIVEHRLPGGPGHPPVAALDHVRAYVRTAALVPVAKLRVLRHQVVLRTPEGRRLAAIDDDEVTVLDGRRLAARFREVDVVVDADQPRFLEGLLERLHAAGAGVVDPTPKIVQALGSRATEPPEVVVDDLAKRATAADAIRRAIAASVVRMLRHDAGVRKGEDPEAVHQARVATRRLRSDLQTFASLLDPDWSTPLRDELRWLAAELGAVRDGEVLLQRLATSAHRLDQADRVVAGRLLRELERDVTGRRGVLLEALETQRYISLLDRLVDASRAPRLRGDAFAPASEVLPTLVARPWEQLRRAVRRLPDPPVDEDLHDIRIRAKRARYAAEAIAPVSGRRAIAFARACAEVQGVLGDFHDAVVAQEWLHAHGRRGPWAFAAGQLLAFEGVAAQHGRDTWKQAWQGLTKKDVTAWM